MKQSYYTAEELSQRAIGAFIVGWLAGTIVTGLSFAVIRALL